MNTNINTGNAEGKTAVYRPTLSFYHANQKGTGCALRFTLHPAHDNTDGSLMLTAANQMTVGDRRGPNPTFSHFDWDGKITVKLDFGDLAKFLQVFRGETESLEDGKGVIHNSPSGMTKIVLRHLIEPITGYSLELYRKARNGDESSAHFVFKNHEALGLAEAIAGSLSVISFGIPMVIAHDTTAYKKETREVRDAAAA